MTPVRLSTLAELLNARLFGADGKQAEQTEIVDVSTDSRNLPVGALFVALVGERFDGHDYAQTAVEQGAAALLVSRELPGVALPQLVVMDTHKAYGQLGAWLRREINPRTLALTGSCGKTTVKQLCAEILAHHAGAEHVLATEANYNNEVGVPKTLLRLTEAHQYAVVELGANHAGEIAWTTSLAQPDVALVTNVAAAHLEGFGSLDGVSRAKFEIFQGVKSGSPVVLNLDCDYAATWLSKLSSQHPCSTFAMSAGAGADCYPSDITALPQGGYQFVLHTPKGEAQIQLALPGRHNIANALAAAAAALALEVPLSTIARALSAVAPVKGRSQMEALQAELWLVDDSYNANLLSVKAAIDLLAEREGQRWLVLGDLAELGDDAVRFHAELGEYARARGLERIFTCGELSAELRGTHFSEQAELLAALYDSIDSLLEHDFGSESQAGRPLTLLVKGSRSAKMDAVAQALRQHYKNLEDMAC